MLFVVDFDRFWPPKCSLKSSWAPLHLQPEHSETSLTRKPEHSHASLINKALVKSMRIHVLRAAIARLHSITSLSVTSISTCEQVRTFLFYWQRYNTSLETQRCHETLFKTEIHLGGRTMPSSVGSNDSSISNFLEKSHCRLPTELFILLPIWTPTQFVSTVVDAFLKALSIQPASTVLIYLFKARIPNGAFYVVVHLDPNSICQYSWRCISQIWRQSKKRRLAELFMNSLLAHRKKHVSIRVVNSTWAAFAFECDTAALASILAANVRYAKTSQSEELTPDRTKHKISIQRAYIWSKKGSAEWRKPLSYLIKKEPAYRFSWILFKKTRRLIKKQDFCQKIRKSVYFSGFVFIWRFWQPCLFGGMCVHLAGFVSIWRALARQMDTLSFFFCFESIRVHLAIYSCLFGEL